MNEKSSSLTLRMGIALFFAFLLHLLLMVLDISPRKDTPSPRLAVLLKAPPLPEKKLEAKKTLPKPEKPKEKPKPKPKPKTPKPKPKKKPVEVRQAKVEKKKKSEFKIPPKKKPKKKPVEKKVVKKVEKPKPKPIKKKPPKVVKKEEPLPEKIVKKILPPKKKPLPQTRMKIENLEQYVRYLEREKATTERNVMYMPAIEVLGGIPLDAIAFFRMKTVVIRKDEVFKKDKSIVVGVDLRKEQFFRIKDPNFYRQFAYLAFGMDKYDTRGLFSQIVQSYRKNFSLSSGNLQLFALIPREIGPIFDWKCLKTIEKSKYKPDDVERIDGKFRRFGDIWVFAIESLHLKTGEEVIIDDFEVKMLGNG